MIEFESWNDFSSHKPRKWATLGYVVLGKVWVGMIGKVRLGWVGLG